MKTVELKIITIAFGVLFTSYLYYLFKLDQSPLPTNLWFNVGNVIDEWFFNGGQKPKEEIENAPNRIDVWINDPTQ